MDGQQDVLDRVLNVAAVTVPPRGKGTQIRRDLLQKSMIGGSVAVVARFPKGSLSENSSIEGAVTVQACTNRICLPPSTLPISAAVSAK